MSLWVSVKNRFSLNGYRLSKKSGFYFLTFKVMKNISTHDIYLTVFIIHCAIDVIHKVKYNVVDTQTLAASYIYNREGHGNGNENQSRPVPLVPFLSRSRRIQ